jgi:hypothetical protein
MKGRTVILRYAVALLVIIALVGISASAAEAEDDPGWSMSSQTKPRIPYWCSPALRTEHYLFPESLRLAVQVQEQG